MESLFRSYQDWIWYCEKISRKHFELQSRCKTRSKWNSRRKLRSELPSPYTEFSPRHLNTEVVPSGVSLTSWGEELGLTLVAHFSSHDVMIKISNGVNYIDQAYTPSYHIGLVKTESKSLDQLTGLGKWTLVVA